MFRPSKIVLFSALAALVCVSLVCATFGSWDANREVGRILSKGFYKTYCWVAFALLFASALPRLGGARGAWQSRLWLTLDFLLWNTLLAQGFKSWLAWPRPSGSPTGAVSGHTLFAVSLACVVSSVYPRLSPLLFGCAAIVGWARMESGAHYPYQVMLGLVIGLGLGWALVASPQGILFPRLINLLRRRRPVEEPESEAAPEPEPVENTRRVPLQRS